MAEYVHRDVDESTSLHNQRPWTYQEVANAVNDACSCGGAEPGKCCEACDVWHNLHRR